MSTSAVDSEVLPIEWVEDPSVTYTPDQLIYQVGGYSGVGSCWDAPPEGSVARLGRIAISDVAHHSADAHAWEFEEEEEYMRNMVDDMAMALSKGQAYLENYFPPLVIFRADDGKTFLVDDGFHRISAAVAADVKHFLAFIF